MGVTSFEFIFACLGAIGIFYIIPSKVRWIFLLLCSLTYYYFFAIPWTFAYVFVSALAVWGAALAFERARTSALPNVRMRLIMWAALMVAVGILAVLKYTPFLFDNLKILLQVLGSGKTLSAPQLIASLGISYYTLQIIAYLLDCYWEQQKAQRNFFKFLLFACYFPQMLLGPISRYSEIGEQLVSVHRFNYQQVTFGLQRMGWGLFKKLVIAERISTQVAYVYNAPGKYDGFYIWIATAIFLLQLYADFSGCIDIMGGISECFGVKLPNNFRQPFFSRSTQEFWQRWHITLGTWVRDYVFYPLLKTRLWDWLTTCCKKIFNKKFGKKIPVYLALLVLWFCMGLWHGGAWHHVIGIGIWFWICIVLSQILEPVAKKVTDFLHIDRQCFSYHLFQSMWVFCIITIGELFFRSGSLTKAWEMFRFGIQKFNPEIFLNMPSLRLGLDASNYNIAVIGILCMLIVSSLQVRLGSVRALIARQNLFFRWLVYYTLIFSVLIFGMYGPDYNPADFIYANF